MSIKTNLIEKIESLTGALNSKPEYDVLVKMSASLNKGTKAAFIVSDLISSKENYGVDSDDSGIIYSNLAWLSEFATSSLKSFVAALESALEATEEETRTFKVVRITTGFSYKAELIKETDCYFVVRVLNFYGEGRHGEERFHKSTMYIEHLMVSLKVTDVYDDMVILNDDLEAITTDKGAVMPFKEIALMFGAIDKDYNLRGFVTGIAYGVNAVLTNKVTYRKANCSLFDWDAINSDDNNVIVNDLGELVDTAEKFGQCMIFINQDRMVVRKINKIY